MELDGDYYIQHIILTTADKELILNYLLVTNGRSHKEGNFVYWGFKNRAMKEMEGHDSR